MNIAEIKKKVDDLAYWGDISPNEVEKDVEYLLSIIEQAENEFNKIWSLSNGLNANEIIIRQKAEEALKAIRN